MIYLIGGTPRSGKTILAKKLSGSLRIPWVPGDSIEGIPKFYVPKKEYAKKFPKDIIRRKTHNSNDLMYTMYSGKEIMAAYITQGDSVWIAIDRLIDSLIAENIDYIVEGYQIPCKKVAQLKKTYPGKIKSVFLIKQDAKKILTGALAHNAQGDWFKTKTSDQKTYTKIAAMISTYGKHIKKEARTSKIKVFNTDSNFYNQINNAIKYLRQ